MTVIIYEKPANEPLPADYIDGMVFEIVDELVRDNINPFALNEQLHPVHPLPPDLVTAIIAHVETLASLPKIDQVPTSGFADLTRHLQQQVDQAVAIRSEADQLADRDLRQTIYDRVSECRFAKARELLSGKP